MADTNTYDLFQKVEKWTTKAKFNALDPRTIETGTEYNLTGAIEESDLASDLQTKISGKLTKPTNPSAESAVTMLADGTVGTKPLSEIGGSGGKMYLHNIHVFFGGDINLYINIINTSNVLITENEYFKSLMKNETVGCVFGPNGKGAVSVNFITGVNNYMIRGVIANGDTPYCINYVGTFDSLSDTVTEL